jgi:hypothetical protein
VRACRQFATSFSGLDSLPVCLWKENTNGLVSLLDLVKDAPVSTLIATLRDVWISATMVSLGNDERYREANLTILLAQIQKLDLQCEHLDLPVTRLHVQDVLAAIGIAHDSPNRREQIDRVCQILSNNLEKEMSLKKYFAMSHEAAATYVRPLKGWEVVVNRWPRTQLDIEESAKSFAFGRFAAAIFHVLLVAESGVIEVADLVEASGDKPGWGCVDRLRRILDKKYSDRSPVEQKHSAFLKENVDMMTAMKDSWRHKITHVDNRLVWLDPDFSPDIASEIIASARGFMRRLAQELPMVP